MATQTAQADQAAEAPAKGAKKKKLIIGVVVLVLLAAGGYLFVGKKSGGPKQPEPGAVVKLDPIQLNLADGHYLKLGLALQATKDAKEAPEGSKALDLAIRLYSQQPMDALSSAKQRENFKKQLVAGVTAAYPDEVMDVYLTEFVMQ